MGMKKKTPSMPMPAPAWRRMIETTNGAAVCCRMYGKGAHTLVLLHGNGENERCFARQIEPFCARFQVLTVESRGHGDSPYARPMTLEAMADDLARVLETLALEQVSIIGFSDGGNVALCFALAHPERLERLVLAGANLFPKGVRRKEQRGIEWGWRICRLLGRFSEKTKRKAERLELMVKQPQLRSEQLAAIGAPTLVLAGIWDLILEEHTKLIAASIPHAHMRIIPASGHFIFRDNPVWVNETILRFLTNRSFEE